MLLLTNPYHLYGKKVIVDLLSRSGAPGPNNTIYYGMEHLFTKYAGIKDTSELLASLDYYFDTEDDFNADKVQPKQFRLEEFNETEYEEEEKDERGEPYSTLKDDPKTFDGYYRRLEDIHSEYIVRYVSNIIYRCAYQGNSSRSISGLRKKHIIQPTLVDVNDDEETEYADTVTYENVDRYSDAEIEYAKDNLNYTLKRLHNLSKYMGVHMLSYISAYERAKDYNIRRRLSGSTKTLTSNDVIAQGVYLCDKNGNFTKRVEIKNKNKHAVEAFEWIKGNNENLSAYIKDYHDLLYYCDVLSIDIINDTELYKIGSSTISQLVVKTVTPNNQYNDQIFKALKANNNTLVESNQLTLEDIIENTVNLVDEACEIDNSKNVFYNITHHNTPYTIDDLHKSGIKLFVNIANYLGMDLDFSGGNFSWKDGYLHYQENLVILDTDLLKADTHFKLNKFIISELGYAIKLTDDDKLIYMSAEVGLYNFNQMTNPNLVVKDYTDWSVCQ